MSSAGVTRSSYNQEDTPLSPIECEAIFRLATKSFVTQYGDRIVAGMSDGDLWEALQRSLGIFGGSGGPGQLSVTYQGAGLKIWGGRSSVNHVTTKPLFSHKATLEMARAVYRIGNPDKDQLDLF